MMMEQNVIVKKMKQKNVKRNIFIFCMLALPILQFLVFFVYVNFNTILMSFQVRGQTVTWGLGNYTRFFKEIGAKAEFGYAIRNSILFGINDIFLLLISVIFAFFFYKKIAGAGMFRLVFFLPSVISMVIFVMVYKYMFDYGIVAKVFGLFGLGEFAPKIEYGADYLVYLVMFYCLWVGTGYNILIIGGAMANLPEDVMEYSRLEGVNYFTELFRIVIPMIWPTISVGILGSVTVMFTLFMQIDLLTEYGGAFGQAKSIAYVINSIVKGNGNLEWASTLGICFTIIAIPIIITVRVVLEKVGDHFN